MKYMLKTLKVKMEGKKIKLWIDNVALQTSELSVT